MDRLTDPDFWAGARDWLIGLGTLGTLAVSVVVLRRQGEELEAQDAERRAEAEYARGAQARQVYFSTSGSGGGSGLTKQYMLRQPVVEVFNDSDDAIHDVVLLLEVIGNVEPGPDSDWKPRAFALVERQSSRKIRLAVRALWSEEEQDYATFTVRPTLMFTDIAGQS